MFSAERLKKYREDRNLSMEDLTFELDKIGFRISRQTIYNWENKVTVPDANALAILASYFKKSIQSFFGQNVSHTGKENKTEEENDK